MAKEQSLKAQVSKPFTRVAQAAGAQIPPALSRDLFDLQPGQAAMAPSREGYAVAQLRDVRTAAPDSDKEGLETFKSRMHAAVAQDVLAQYASALRTRYEVRIDRGAIDRLFNEGSLGQY